MEADITLANTNTNTKTNDEHDMSLQARAVPQGMYAIASISTRRPSAGSAAACTVVLAGR